MANGNLGIPSGELIAPAAPLGSGDGVSFGIVGVLNGDSPVMRPKPVNGNKDGEEIPNERSGKTGGSDGCCAGCDPPPPDESGFDFSLSRSMPMLPNLPQG